MVAIADWLRLRLGACLSRRRGLGRGRVGAAHDHEINCSFQCPYLFMVRRGLGRGRVVAAGAVESAELRESSHLHRLSGSSGPCIKSRRLRHQSCSQSVL